MTQEELDALMNGGMDDLDFSESSSEAPESNVTNDDDYDKNFHMKASMDWPPPPPSKEHQVVHQLDDVTRESEKKASEIFDLLDLISNEAMTADESMKSIQEALKSHQAVFEKLQAKFPMISLFEEEADKASTALMAMDELHEKMSTISDNVLMAMDIMQYQDIHRQKIERVINVMRALSRYMNRLFEGKIDDEKRVTSATHIAGDMTDDLVDEDDIEALIASFGQK